MADISLFKFQKKLYAVERLAPDAHELGADPVELVVDLVDLHDGVVKALGEPEEPYDALADQPDLLVRGRAVLVPRPYAPLT